MNFVQINFFIFITVDNSQFHHISYDNLPIVGMCDTGNESSEKRRRRQVLPTEESPIMMSLSKWS
jgi:hypothetical protein